jgi:hypothetical protein
MAKKQISKKRSFCLEDMQIVKSKKMLHLLKHDPRDFFKSHEKVASALLTSLEEDDPGAFLEILDVYLKVNRTKNIKRNKII